MTYNPGIPTGTVNLDQDYLNLQANFTQLDAHFKVNHYPLTDISANLGKHTVIQFPQQSPAPTAAVSEIALFGFAGAGGTDLVMVRDGNVATQTHLTTAKMPFPIPGAGVGQDGRSWLPGEIMLIWGSFNPNVDINVLFHGGGFPNFCVNLQLTVAANANNPTIRQYLRSATLSKTGFQWGGSVNSDITAVYYLAIGN